MFFGLLVLVAEVVVYMGYINKIEDARDKERKKKEVKKVVRSINLKLISWWGALIFIFGCKKVSKINSKEALTF